MQKTWCGQPSLQFPRTVEITRAGIIDAIPIARHEYQWPSIIRTIETPNLFILLLSEFSFLMLPKRAMDTPQRAEFLYICDEVFGGERRGAAKNAFPVLPGPAS